MLLVHHINQNTVCMYHIHFLCLPYIMWLYVFSRNYDDNATHYRDSFVEVMNEIDV